MSIAKSFYFVPKVIPAGRLGAGLTAALVATGIPIDQDALEFTVHEDLADSSKSSTAARLDALDRIVDLRQVGLSVTVGLGLGPNWHFVGVFCGPPGVASLFVQVPTAGVGTAIFEAFTSVAGVEPYTPPPRSPAPASADADAAQVASPHAPPPATESQPRRLRAFITYRYGQPTNETNAALLQHFLELQNVEVLTGRSYEPRPLHEKVTAQLAGIDFLVLLIGPDGESMWTRDEIGTARAAGAVVIPIVAEGAEFARGLFGDLEYISFAPDHIADSFIPLLEAVIYVRRRSA